MLEVFVYDVVRVVFAKRACWLPSVVFEVVGDAEIVTVLIEVIVKVVTEEIVVV